MNYRPLPLLLVMLSSRALSADIGPTKLLPFEHDLGRIPSAGETSQATLRFRYEKAKDLIASPDSDQALPYTFVAREIQSEFQLNPRFALGLGLRTSKETIDLEGFDSIMRNGPERPLTSAFWMKFALLQTSLTRTQIALQYEPGQGSPFALRQVSQDRSTLGLSQELFPTSWLSFGLYAYGSRREDEAYQAVYLGDEVLWGGRLALGPSWLRIFADAQSRQLTLKTVGEDSEVHDKIIGRSLTTGLNLAWQGWELQAMRVTPIKHQGLGLTKSDTIVALSYSFGQKSDTSAVSSSEDLPKTLNKTKKSEKTVQPVPEPTPGKASPPLDSTLSDEEMDEFERLDRELAAEAKGPQETPQEKAERELRTLREAEKLEEEQAKIEAEKQRLEDQKRARKEIKEESEAYDRYRLDVEDEIDRYTLPDSEELNWKGLQGP